MVVRLVSGGVWRRWLCQSTLAPAKIPKAAFVCVLLGLENFPGWKLLCDFFVGASKNTACFKCTPNNYNRIPSRWFKPCPKKSPIWRLRFRSRRSSQKRDKKGTFGELPGKVPAPIFQRQHTFPQKNHQVGHVDKLDGFTSKSNYQVKVIWITTCKKHKKSHQASLGLPTAIEL